MGSRSQEVLLTGGAGFIGSRVAEALLRRGARLTIVDNLDSFYASAWKRENLAAVARAGRFEFVEADICDEKAIRPLFARVRPAAIIHLAARAGVRPSIEQPLLYEKVNVQGTVTLLEIARGYGASKFIFGSSSSVYGNCSRMPFSESELELRPISPYGATKLAGEMYCHTYAHLYSLPVVCLRFFTVFGPRQRPDLAIYKFTSLMEAGAPVPIYGDGSTGRDYTYIDDIVEGVLSALDCEPRGAGSTPFEVFNLGNSHPVKLLELVELLERVTGRRANLQFVETQPGDVTLTWADITRASQRLGYAPQTGLEEGLKKLVEWYRSVAAGRQAQTVRQAC